MKLLKPDNNAPFLLQFRVFDSAANRQVTACHFLQHRLAGGHREQLPAWFSQQRVRLDGRIIAADQSLEIGQSISIEIPGHREENANLEWQTIWQNDELLVAYKPPLLPVSRTTRNLYHTLISLVRHQTPWQDARLLHRLDTETDGLIVLAKHREADQKWKPRLTELLLFKRYQARVYGNPDWQQQTCSATLDTRPDSAIRCQMHIQPPQADTGKSCLSLFTKLASNTEYSLIECELKTGRKHQLRAHLAHLGHPIVGDKIYAHSGKYYLKRLQAELDARDLQLLGGPHHQLTATTLILRPESESPPVEIVLSDSLNSTGRIFLQHQA